jgi:hypothetical protein
MQRLDRNADKGTLSQWLEQDHALPRIAGAHPFVIQLGLSGVAWFLAVAWLDFSDGLKVGLVPSLVVGLFVMYLTLCCSPPLIGFSRLARIELAQAEGTERRGSHRSLG